VADGFRPLAVVLRERTAARIDLPEDSALRSPQIEDDDARSGAVPPPTAASGHVVAFCSEIALGRLAALEAFERAAVRLMETLARDVLGRELAIAPVDLAALVRNLVATFDDAPPIAVVVAPSDAEALTCDLNVRTDPTLSSGDLVLIVQDGTIDARLPLRLRAAVGDAIG
jgi:hypothetical protein